MLSWAWDFDHDGTTDATDPNPTWTYTVESDTAFSVMLTVSNGVTTSALLREAYVTFEDVATGIDAERHAVPDGFELGQNYPNPFNPTTVIPLRVPYASEVELTVYNLLGQQVKRLFSGLLEPGSHTVMWDARDEQGHPVSSGLYLYVLTTNHGHRLTRRLMHIK